MPKDKCEICGRPCVGRYCWTHLGESLEACRQLYQKDEAAWKQQVDQANEREVTSEDHQG
jgi:ribosome-binding protein aMBF1 (putative translation factor)